MHERMLRLVRDDPQEPGLLRRVYARVAVSWDQARGGWSWTLLNAAGQPCRPAVGPFEGPEVAFDAARLELCGPRDGHWESGIGGV